MGSAQSGGAGADHAAVVPLHRAAAAGRGGGLGGGGARALVLVDVGPEVSVDGANEGKRFVAGPYELESLDAWVDHTHQYYPWRSKERIRARLKVSLTETEGGAFAKQ